MRYNPGDDFSSNFHLEVITFDRDEALSQSHHWQWHSEGIPRRNGDIDVNVVRRVSSAVESWRRERLRSNNRQDPSEHLQTMDNYEENNSGTVNEHRDCRIPFSNDMIKFIVRTIVVQCFYFALFIACFCSCQSTQIRLVKGDHGTHSLSITKRWSLTFKSRNLSMIGSCVRKRMSLAR